MSAYEYASMSPYVCSKSIHGTESSLHAIFDVIPSSDRTLLVHDIYVPSPVSKDAEPVMEVQLFCAFARNLKAIAKAKGSGFSAECYLMTPKAVKEVDTARITNSGFTSAMQLFPEGVNCKYNRVNCAIPVTVSADGVIGMEWYGCGNPLSNFNKYVLPCEGLSLISETADADAKAAFSLNPDSAEFTMQTIFKAYAAKKNPLTNPKDASALAKGAAHIQASFQVVVNEDGSTVFEIDGVAHATMKEASTKMTHLVLTYALAQPTTKEAKAACQFLPIHSDFFANKAYGEACPKNETLRFFVHGDEALKPGAYLFMQCVLFFSRMLKGDTDLCTLFRLFNEVGMSVFEAALHPRSNKAGLPVYNSERNFGGDTVVAWFAKLQTLTKPGDDANPAKNLIHHAAEIVKAVIRPGENNDLRAAFLFGIGAPIHTVVMDCDGVVDAPGMTLVMHKAMAKALALAA